MADAGAWNQGWALGSERAQESRLHKQALQDKELEMKVNDLIEQRKGHLAKLSELTKGTPEYDQSFNALRQTDTDLRLTLHPDTNPGAFAKFGHLLTDHLGLTSKVKREVGVAQQRSSALAGDQRAAIGQAAAVPPSQEQQAVTAANAQSAGTLAAIKADMKAFMEFNPEADLDQQQAHLNDLLQKYQGLTTAGNWINVPGTLNGQPATLLFDKKTRQYRTQGGELVPAEMMATWVPKPTSQTKPKGLKFDPQSGQVIDQDTAKRYSRGDVGTPPEVAALFKSQEAWEAKQDAFKLKLAQSSRAEYNMTRPMQVLDTANGNAPTVVTFQEMRKSPNRYLPSGEADKALAKENLMQDITGTSQLTRQAINNLKEDFPLDMKAKIAVAVSADNPASALSELISSGTLGSLSEDQQDFLISTRQLAENAMAMRTILGAGQGSEDMRDAIRATLPSLLSPDRSYALRQLDAFDKTIARLHRGVPKVPLRTDIGGSGSSTGRPQGATHKQQDPQTKIWYYVDKEGNVKGRVPSDEVPKK